MGRPPRGRPRRLDGAWPWSRAAAAGQAKVDAYHLLLEAEARFKRTTERAVAECGRYREESAREMRVMVAAIAQAEQRAHSAAAAMWEGLLAELDSSTEATASE